MDNADSYARRLLPVGCNQRQAARALRPDTDAAVGKAAIKRGLASAIPSNGVNKSRWPD